MLPDPLQERGRKALLVVTAIKSNTQEKNWQVESAEHIEQYRIKFVETSHYLDDVDVKRS